MDKPITFKAFSGLDLRTPPERLKPEDLVEALNIEIGPDGELTRRAGYTLARAGDSHSLWSDGTTAFFVSGTTLYRLNADMSATALGTVVASPMSYHAVAGRIYMSNGVQSMVWDNGTLRSWGMVPPRPPGAQAIGGVLPAGRYLFTQTFIRSDGQESGAPIASVIDLPDASGIRFTASISNDPGVQDSVIYLSQPNGEVMYRAFRVGPTLSVDFIGSEVSLVTPLDRLYMREAPAGQLVTHYNGRMYVASGGIAFASQPYGYELFDPRDWLGADASEITLMAPVTDGMFVGTRERVLFWQGSGPEDFRVIPKAPVGAIPGTLQYLDPEGVKLDGWSGKVLAAFTSRAGIVLVGDGGLYLDLTQLKFDMPAYQRGAALYRNDGQQRYVTVLHP